MKRITFFRTMLLVYLIMVGILSSYGQFSAGNLVVEQIGDGTTALSGSSTTVKLLQFTPTGTPGTSTSFFSSAGTPTTSPYNIVESGSATSNGYISLSTDKAFVVVPGYNAPNATASIAASASATYGRTIGKVTSTGALQTNGTFNALTGNNYRSIVSNGSSYWLGGGIGIVYTPTDVTSGITTTCTSIITTNTRILNIFNNTLFASTSSTSFNGTGSNLGIYQIGSTFNALPTATVTATTNVNIINTATGSSPYAFAFSPDGLTCYVADDRSTTAGGVQKWIYSGTFSASTGWSGGTWTLSYTLGTGATNIGARGLTVDFSGTNPVIYGTSAEGSLNRVFSITDTGSASTATTLATATANYIFRGICFAPQAIPTISVVESYVPNMAVDVNSRTINVSGSNLTGDITLAISGTNAVQFDVTPKTLTQTAGVVASTPVTISYSNNGSNSDAAILTLSSSGATSKTFNLVGGITTGMSQVFSTLSVSASDGVIHFTAVAGKMVELYNAVGQKLLIKQTVDGMNSIPISTKGLVVLKVGNQIAKVVL